MNWVIFGDFQWEIFSNLVIGINEELRLFTHPKDRESEIYSLDKKYLLILLQLFKELLGKIAGGLSGQSTPIGGKPPYHNAQIARILERMDKAVPFCGRY
ncbi:hypothetical protein [Laspinema palackyanum]|uniref:hypothetical protein n=1 Tax=Laspinema palackyanum TaxID=3231601 RepID=UPI00345D4AE0|nr:hypothetical protein [Laspinema sp. D2c]